MSTRGQWPHGSIRIISMAGQEMNDGCFMLPDQENRLLVDAFTNQLTIGKIKLSPVVFDMAYYLDSLFHFFFCNYS